jgi:DNA-binding NarL/FixJ family response regulator
VVDAITAVASGGSLLDADSTKKLLARVRAGPLDADPGLASLTRRERTILGYLVEGSTNREISAAVLLAEKTVKNYVSRILHKLGLAHRAELAAYVTKARPEAAT